MKIIRAAHDNEGIYVYQAFTPSIVAAAVEKGTVGAGFKMERMTWIKPSLGWMLYRSGYATRPDQEAILKIKLTHDGFTQALRWAVLSTYNPAVYPTENDWQTALKNAPVRVQWDPDRNLRLGKLERRAIQIGLRGKAVYACVNDWIIDLEDITPLVHTINNAIKNSTPLPPVPDEQPYPVDDEIQQRLAMS